MGAEAGRLQRRSIRLKGFDYSHSGAYFVTMVTQDRLPLFGEVLGGEMRFSPFGNIARQQWERLPRRFSHIGLDEFVVMPNHIHGIVVIYDDDGWGTAGSLDNRGGTAGSLDNRGGTAGCSNDKARESSRRALTKDLADMRWGTADRLNDYGLELFRDWATADRFNGYDYESSRRRGTADRLNDYGLELFRRAPTDMTTREQFGKPVPGSIPTIIRSYKSAVAYRVNLIRGTPGAEVWQRNYYEHIIRNEVDTNRITRYIIENPAQWETDDENRPHKD